MRVARIALGCATLSGTLALAAPAASQKELPSPEEMFQAWKALDPADARDTLDWFVAECDRADHFRAQLERYALGEAGRIDQELPAAGDTPTFDPARHCPAQVIPRRFVDADDPRHGAAIAKLTQGTGRALVPAVRYDWASGRIVRVRPWDDPERLARNASRGFSPATDFVEAWVTGVLDRGEERAAAAAFAHAYSDRNGNAYREVTLFEAWCSGTEIEMPDVECLGIVHALDHDWTTYVAPVPPRQHQALYTRIGEHFSAYRRYRDLREALARTYLTRDPVLPTGYGPARERLHAFWERAGSDPAALAKDLPDAEGWRAWFAEQSKVVDGDEELVARRAARSRALWVAEDWTRRTFHGILTEYGAYEKAAAGGAPPAERPPAPAPPSPPGGGGGR